MTHLYFLYLYYMYLLSIPFQFVSSIYHLNFLLLTQAIYILDLYSVARREQALFAQAFGKCIFSLEAPRQEPISI